jgi:4-hydroxythreonine-4-phosphate dehydrogenase
VRAIRVLSEAQFDENTTEVIDLNNVDTARLQRGRVNAAAGQAAFEYIKTATQLALDGAVDGLVTSAINKESLNRAGHHYNGHTELLAELCGSPEVAMMLIADRLRTIHVSTHISLREALNCVRPERILVVLRLANRGLRELGFPNPSLAVAALNPHAGEGGLFGNEETQVIAPAIAAAIEEGISASGPYPPDTIFFRAAQGAFDGVIALYHDQGHIATKMLGIWLGVNVTLGLPIVRTSVEHGTNFEMAGKGTSDPRSMTKAIELATLMAIGRQRSPD